MKTPGELYKEQLELQNEQSDLPEVQRAGKKKLLVILVVFLLLLGLIGGVAILGLQQLAPELEEEDLSTVPSQVLSESAELFFRVNSRSTFADIAEFLDDVSFDGEAVFNQGLSTNNQDIDAGTGNVFAANIPESFDSFLQQITAGSGISISDDGTSTITNTGVTSVNGSTGAVSLTAGSGISISGTTISSTVTAPNASNSFANIFVSGQATVSAGSSTDTLTFTPGSGISLTTNSGTKELIIAASGTASQWTTSGSNIYYTTGNVGIGTNSPGSTLDVTGTIRFGSLANGFLRADGSGNVTVSAVSLNSDVTGVLPVANGGTGATSLNDLITLGTMTTGNYVAGVTVGNGLAVSGSAAEGWIPGLSLDVTTSGTTASTSSNSGLETSSDGLSLLRGCSTGEILKWSGAVWQCDTDSGGGGGGGITNIQEGGVNIVTSSTAINFVGSDFVVTNSGGGTGAVAIDYANSNITRSNQNESITGTWTFDDITLNGDTFTDLTGTGLQINAGVLETTLGTSVSLTTEVTGTLPIGNGGTGLATTATNGQLLIGNGSGYSLATITEGEGIDVTNGSGSITIAGELASSSNLGLASFTTTNFTVSSGAVSITNDSIGDTQLAFDTGQALTTTSSPTFNGLTVSSLTRGSDTITDFTGTGLQINSGALEATLGTSVNLTTEVTGILPLANGGTNANLTAVNGGILYSNASGMNISAAGTSGQILQSNGAAAPTWVDASTVGVNYWQRLAGNLSPLALNDTLSATTSASTALTLTQTGAFDVVRFEDQATDTSPFIINQAGNVGIGLTNPSSLLHVSGTANITGATTLGATLAVTSTITAATDETINGIDINAGVISDVTSFTVNADTITDFTGTGLQVNAGALETTLGTSVSLTSEVSGILPLANGGTNASLTAAAGGIVYSDADSFEVLAAGTAGYVLQSNGTSAPSWVPSSGVGTNYWQQNSGSLAPITITDSLVLGGGTTTPFFFEVNGRKTGKALVSLNETGDQNILTASASGATRFTVTNSGNIGFAGNSGVMNTLTSAATTGRTYTLPDNTGTICIVEAGNCAGSGSGLTGSGTATQVAFFSGGTQNLASDSNLYWNNTSKLLGIGTSNPISKMDISGAVTGKALVNLNETGDQPIFTASSSGTNRFTIANNGVLTTSYGTGILKSNGSGIISSSAVNLASSDVTGTLAIGNGGTGLTSTATNGQLLIGNGSGYTLAALSEGEGIDVTNGAGSITIAGELASDTNLGIASFTTTNFTVSSGAVSITNNSIGDTQLAFDTGQALTTTSSPTFNGLTVSSLTRGSDTISDFTGTGLQMNSGALETTLGTSVSLTSEVSGILPLANGGTNANLTAVNGGIVYSNASALAVSAAGSSGQVLTSGGAGAPVWVDAGTVGTNYWQRVAGNLSPVTLNDTLSATTSATTALTITQTGAFDVVRFEDQASDTSPFIINQAGNVGIGNTAPGQELDVAGDILIGANSTFDVRAAGTLDIGTTTQTGLTVGRAGATTTINGSTLTVGATSWTATPTISGLITATLGVTANGALTANNTFTLGDNGDIGSIDTSDWDISTTGVLTGISGITTDGAYTQSGSSANAFSGATTISATGTALTISGAATTGLLFSNTGLTTDITLQNGESIDNNTDGTITLTSTTLALSGTTTMSGTSLTAFNGGATAIDFAEFDVSASTGSITINDGGDAGNISIEGSILDINTLDFVGVGAITTGGSTNLTLDPSGGSVLFNNNDVLNVGGAAATAYNFFAGSTAGSSLADGDDDLYIAGELEVDGGALFSPAGTDDVIFTADTDSDVRFNGLASGTGNALCIDTGASDRLVTCTVGSGGISGSGTVGQIPYFNGTSSITSETSGFAWDFTNNRLGIGNDSPVGKLDLTGANIGKALAIFNETGNQDIFTASASGTTRFVITNAGNVGIGTTAPTASLDIAGATGASTSGILTFRGTTDPAINFLNGENLNFQSSVGGDAGLTSRLFINGNSGNIGIGTTTTGAKLTMPSGDISFGDSSNSQMIFEGTTGLDSTIQHFFSNFAMSFNAGGKNIGGSGYTRFTTNTATQINMSTGGLSLNWVPSGTAGALFNWNTGLMLTTAGNVGIGTTAPGAQLEVTRPLAWGVNGKALAIFNQIENQDIFTASSSGTTRFVIRNDGNVGIGLSNPSQKLYIYESGNADIRLALETAGTTKAAYLDLIGTNTSYGGIQQTANGTVQWFMGNNGDTAGSLNFYTSSSLVNRMMINSTGNIGIGSTAPGASLYVTRPLSFGANGKALAILDQIENQDIFTASASGTTRFVIKNDGNVGIGTTTPTTFKLELAGSIGPSTDDTYDLGSDTRRFRDLYLGPDTLHIGTSTSDEYAISYNTTSNYLGFNVNGSGNADIVFDASGNVGIGTTAPSQLLEVAGNIELSGATARDIYFGSVGSAAPGAGSVGQKIQLWGTVGTVGVSDYGIGIETNNMWFNTDSGFKWYEDSSQIMTLASGGNLGIGTTSTSEKLVVGGTGSANSILLNDINTAEWKIQTGGYGLGFANDYDDNGTYTKQMFLDNNGNVGIGTTAPAAKLHLSGTGQTSNTPSYPTGNQGGTFVLADGSNGAGNGGMLVLGALNGAGTDTAGFAAIKGSITNGASNGTGDMLFLTRNAIADASFTERMRILANGNVGIGTTAPQATLDIVHPNTAAGGIRLQDNLTNATNKFASIKMGHYTNAEEPITFFYGRSDSSNNVINIGGNFASENAATYIQFFTGATTTTTTGTNRMTIDPNGNVGIGTSLPGSNGISNTKLELVDNDFARLTLIATDPATDVLALFDARGDGSNRVEFGSVSNHDVYFYSNDTERMRMRSGGTFQMGNDNGETGADSLLDLAGNFNALTDVGSLANYLFHVRNNDATDGEGAGIAFSGSTLSTNVGASIIFVDQGTNSIGDLRFYTKSDTTNGADPVARMTIASAGNVGIGTTTPTSFKLQVDGDIGPNAAPTITSTSQTASALDSTNDAGQYTAMKIGTDGLPVIAYYYVTGGDLKVIKCGDSTCSSGNTTTSVDTTNNVGQYSSLAIGADGFPVISYYDATSGNLVLTKCGNAACSSGNTTTAVDSTGDVGQYTSVAISIDGFPVIAYYDVTNTSLKVIKCGNAACTSGNTTTTMDSTNDVGQHTSMAIGADGFPIIVYYYVTGADMRVVKCTNTTCTAGVFTTVETTNNPGRYSSVAIGTDGLPVISYNEGSGADLKVMKCGDAFCALGNSAVSIDTTNLKGFYSSLAIGTDGLPVISYLDNTNGDLMVAKCTNPSCANGAYVTTVESTNSVGQYTSLAISADGLPIISQYDVTNGDLRIVKCAISSCSITSANDYTGGSNLGSQANFFANVYAMQYWGKSFQIADFSDLAENYMVEGSSTKGDIVRVKEGTTLTKTTKAYDEKVIGIVSTNPGITLGAETGTTPVALAGRVPVNIASDSASIEPGDHITSSEQTGKGMKATSAGMVVGVALESWTPDDPDGQVLVYVSRGFHEPDFALNDSGDISVVLVDNDPLFTKYAVKEGTEKIEKKGLFSELFAGNVTAGLIEAADIRIGGKSLKDFLTGLDGTASGSATASSSAKLGDTETQLADLRSQMASMSARFASIETLAQQSGTTTQLLDQLLNSPLLSASGSGILGASTTTESLIVGDTLQVLGHTTLSDLGVTGNITAGLVSINGLDGSINTVGETLKLQNLGVAGIDILNGKVTIDTTGNIKASGKLTVPAVETKKLFIKNDQTDDATIGTGEIIAGGTAVTIMTTSVKEDSKIFVTATTPTGKQTLIVESKNEGSSFVVRLESPHSENITFDWWIIN